MKEARITRLHPVLNLPKNEEVYIASIRPLILIHVQNFKHYIIQRTV